MKKLLSSILILTLSFYSFNLESLAMEFNNQGKPEQTLSDLDADFSTESKNKQDKPNDIEEVKNSARNENDKKTIMEKTADAMKENLKKHNEQIRNEIQKIKDMSGWEFKLYLIKSHFNFIFLILDAIFLCSLFGYYSVKNYNLGFKAGQEEFLKRSRDSVNYRSDLYTELNNFKKSLGKLLTAIKSGEIKNFDNIKSLYYNATNFYDTYLR